MVMESIAERAKSYVEGCELQGKEARKPSLITSQERRRSICCLPNGGMVEKYRPK